MTRTPSLLCDKLTSTAPTLRDGGESAARQIHDAIASWERVLCTTGGAAHWTIDLRVI